MIEKKGPTNAIQHRRAIALPMIEIRGPEVKRQKTILHRKKPQLYLYFKFNARIDRPKKML